MTEQEERRSRIEEIKYQWAAYKCNTQSLTREEFELLQSQAKKYGVVLK